MSAWPDTGNCNPHTAVCNPYMAICGLQMAICNPHTGVCSLHTAICDPQTAVCSPDTRICSLQTGVSGAGHVHLRGVAARLHVANAVYPAGHFMETRRTHPSATCITRVDGAQTAGDASDTAVCALQMGVSGLQTAVCDLHPGVSGLHPGVSGVHPGVCGLRLSVFEPQLRIRSVKAQEPAPAHASRMSAPSVIIERLMIIAIGLFLASRAASQLLIPPDKLPLHLRPLAGATNVVAAGAGGDFAVHYNLAACYPASVQLELLSKRLPGEWVPRKEDFLNPGIPTSQVRGWTHYEDDTSEPHAHVDRWSGEWGDRSGRILTYDLIYRSRTVNDGRCNLEITASQLSAPTARALEPRGRYRTGPVAAIAPRRTDAIRIVNPEFIVLRPLANQPVPGATAASMYGRQVFFKPSDRILDLRQLAPETAEIRPKSGGVFVLLIETTPEGAKALKAWTSTHLDHQLGVFLENRLIAAPVISSPLDDFILIDGGFTRSQAEEVRQRLLRGGAR